MSRSWSATLDTTARCRVTTSGELMYSNTPIASLSGVINVSIVKAALGGRSRSLHSVLHVLLELPQFHRGPEGLDLTMILLTPCWSRVKCVGLSLDPRASYTRSAGRLRSVEFGDTGRRLGGRLLSRVMNCVQKLSSAKGGSDIGEPVGVGLPYGRPSGR